MDVDDTITSKIEFDTHEGKNIRIKCAYCQHTTNQRVLKSVEENWNSDYIGMGGTNIYSIVQCLGCDVISYCKESSDTETSHYEKNEKGEVVTVYDVSTEQHPVVNTNYKSPRYFSSMPKNVESVYHETHKALLHGFDKLAGVGIRMIVEMVCLENGIKRGKLDTKIEKLFTDGLVTEQMKYKSILEMQSLAESLVLLKQTLFT